MYLALYITPVQMAVLKDLVQTVKRGLKALKTDKGDSCGAVAEQLRYRSRERKVPSSRPSLGHQC